jgi:hypothetical protein
MPSLIVATKIYAESQKCASKSAPDVTYQTDQKPEAGEEEIVPGCAMPLEEPAEPAEEKLETACKFSLDKSVVLSAEVIQKVLEPVFEAPLDKSVTKPTEVGEGELQPVFDEPLNKTFTRPTEVDEEEIVTVCNEPLDKTFVRSAEVSVGEFETFEVPLEKSVIKPAEVIEGDLGTEPLDKTFIVPEEVEEKEPVPVCTDSATEPIDKTFILSAAEEDELEPVCMPSLNRSVIRPAKLENKESEPVGDEQLNETYISTPAEVCEEEIVPVNGCGQSSSSLPRQTMSTRLKFDT